MTNYSPKAIAAAIVAVLAPLILAFATFVANEAQTRFDMHLEGAALAVYITGFLIVTLAAAITLAEHVAKILIARALASLGKKDVAVSSRRQTAVVAPRGGGEN